MNLLLIEDLEDAELPTMSSNEANPSRAPYHSHRKHPCVPCQQRKIKCDRSEPCGNCEKAGVQCISAATLPPRKRKQRFPEAELLARLRRYEHHLRIHGADIDAINREGGSSVPTHPNRVKSDQSDSSRNGPGSLSPKPLVVQSLSVRRSLRHVENNLNFGADEEFRDAEEILQGSSDDDMFANPTRKTYEQLGGEGRDLLFEPQAMELRSLHPSPLRIFQLWQTFLDNVNPLTKIFHAPTMQQKVLDAAANLENIPRNMEALMFGIYASATISLNDEDYQKLFNEVKSVALKRFQSGARQALANAGYLRSSDIVVLQAFVLYLLASLQMTIDPRSLLCLTGISVRIAQRMGLSTDGTTYAIPPFETEMRRRLWWQIILIDTRVAELSGAGTSVLTYVWNTKLPSNVNDSDLFPDMRDPPVEQSGLTEMIFLRIRCEIVKFVQESRAITRSLNIKDEAIDEFETRIEREYLSYCNPLVPLHFMSTMMASSALCKLRMGLCHPHFMPDRTHKLPEVEMDRLFRLSLRILEIHNTVMARASVRQYIWHIHTNFPFPAHICLIWALRYRTSDEFADKAWQQLSESHEHRNKHDSTIARKKDSLLHSAVANLTVRAWEAREAALQPFQHAFPVPPFVSRYQQQLRSKQSQGSAEIDISTTNPTGELFEGQISTQCPKLDPNSIDMGQAFDQAILPGLFPNDVPPAEWEFWNNMMQGGAI